MIENIFLIGFFFIAIVELYSEHKDNRKLIFSTKPLLMPLLIFFYIFGVIENATIAQVNWLIVIALLGGWAGDIFLMLENQDKWFLYGMIAFLLNQLFFIISFFMSITNIMSFDLWGLLLLGPVFLILIFMVPRFITKTGELKIPVLVYLFAILLMHIFTVFRLAQFQGLTFILVYIGSISFIFSDATIAVNKWDNEVPQGRTLIMATYLLAQFFITVGILLGNIS